MYVRKSSSLNYRFIDQQIVLGVMSIFTSYDGGCSLYFTPFDEVVDAAGGELLFSSESSSV